MKIHTSTADWNDIHDAARLARVDFEELSTAGSRSRSHAFNVKLLGSSPSRPNSGHHGANGDAYAASWDEFGIFLAHIFRNDPLAIAGDYLSGVHFHWTTGNRFATLTWEQQCRPRHKWGMGQRNVTGAYSVSECEKGCGATKRWMLHGHTFAEIQVV